jgi:hypothetical protein
MPRTAQYSGDSGKVGSMSSGGSTGVPSADGGLDTNADIVFEIPTTTYYTRIVGEANLTVFERENLGKAIPSAGDMRGATGVSIDNVAWTYDESLANKSREAAASPNETYASASQSSDTRRDFSKGHGAAAPTMLAPECSQVGSADLTPNPAKNPDTRN